MRYARYVAAVALVCAFPTQAEDARGWPITLTNDENTPVQLPVPGVQATVLVFTTPGCPIANRYAPVLAGIAREYDGKVRFFRLYADDAVTAKDAAKQEETYHYGFPALFDPEQQAVACCGATRTPEIAVIDAKGVLRYRGAVDDQYSDFGTYRREATKHYLRDALDALLSGKEVPIPRTEALGCFIPERETRNVGGDAAPRP